MSLVQINRSPSAHDLRVFATLWLIFLGVGAVVAAGRGWAVVAGSAGALAVLVGAAGWLAPARVKWVYLAACYATLPIGFVVSHLLLAGIYFLVVTPVGLLLRICRHDPLQRAFDRRRSTYWIKRGPRPPPESYFRQH